MYGKEMDLEEFKKKFPNLYKELIEGRGRIVSTYIDYNDRSADPWRGYEPSPIDYIRRAKTVDEALEVIDFLEKVGELKKDRADELRRLVREKGLHVLGPRKRNGYYFLVGGRYTTS